MARCRLPGPLLLASLLMALPALAGELVVSSGAEGGYYHAVGRRLTFLMGGRGFLTNHQASVGSRQNLERLADPLSPVTVALAQADALHRYLEEHPDRKERFAVLTDVGRECVVLVSPREGGVANAAELKARGGSIVVRSPESGAAVTHQALTRMDPTYGSNALVYGDPVESLLAMQFGGGGAKPTAVMLVERPRSHSPALELVLANRDAYAIAAVEPGHVAGSPPVLNGAPVYSFDEVTSGFGSDRRTTYRTLCTRGLLLASRSKLSPEDLQKLRDALKEQGSYIAPGRGR